MISVSMIYVISKNWLQVVCMARNHTFLKDPFSCYNLNISQVDANMGYWQGVRSDIFDKTY